VGSKRDNLKRRVRKTVKWGGALVTVALITSWIASMWWEATIYSRSLRFGVLWHSGLIVLVSFEKSDPPPEDEAWISRSQPHHFMWWFGFERTMDGWDAGAPLLPLALPTLALTIFAWHRDAAIRRRLRSGCCSCGYDRAGLAAGAVCPECGKQPEAR